MLSTIYRPEIRFRSYSLERFRTCQRLQLGMYNFPLDVDFFFSLWFCFLFVVVEHLHFWVGASILLFSHFPNHTRGVRLLWSWLLMIPFLHSLGIAIVIWRFSWWLLDDKIFFIHPLGAESSSHFLDYHRVHWRVTYPSGYRYICILLNLSSFYIRGTTYCRSDWRVAVDGVFGTSKRAQRSRDHPSRPKLNQRLGTISYSPNEQVQGKSQLSWNWIREPIQLIVRLLLGFSRVLSSACRWIISIIPFEKQK